MFTFSLANPEKKFSTWKPCLKTKNRTFEYFVAGVLKSISNVLRFGMHPIQREKQSSKKTELAFFTLRDTMFFSELQSKKMKKKKKILLQALLKRAKVCYFNSIFTCRFFFISKRGIPNIEAFLCGTLILRFVVRHDILFLCL